MSSRFFGGNILKNYMSETIFDLTRSQNYTIGPLRNKFIIVNFIANPFRPQGGRAAKTQRDVPLQFQGAVFMEIRREQLLIDPEKCTGCGRCLMACAMQHCGSVNPSLARIKILPLPSHEIHVPVICMACEDAPCIKVCPMNARLRQANKTVVTNADVCIGCRACVYICPVGAPAIIPYTCQTMTCDLCEGDPAGLWCVTACDEGALTISKSDRLTSDKTRARARLARLDTKPV